MGPFVSGFFHSACFQVHPQCSVYQYLIPSSWLNTIPLHGYTKLIYLFISWWTFGLFSVWLLWIMLWTFINKFLNGCMFSSLLCYITGVELPDHGNNWDQLCKELLSTVAAQSYIPTSSGMIHQTYLRCTFSSVDSSSNPLYPCSHFPFSVF